MGRVRHGAVRKIVAFVAAVATARTPTVQLERRPNLAGPAVVSHLRAAAALRVARHIAGLEAEHAVEF